VRIRASSEAFGSYHHHLGASSTAAPAQPALPGRPRTIRPVGFAGGQPVQARTRAIEGGAVKYRGLLISNQ
jgi:hypothetical protein